MKDQITVPELHAEFDDLDAINAIPDVASRWRQEISMEYRQSAEHHDDDGPLLCVECHKVIGYDDEAVNGDSVKDWLHVECDAKRTQRAEERWFLVRIEQLHAEIAELLRESPLTGLESAAGKERRAIVEYVSCLLSRAKEIGKK